MKVIKVIGKKVATLGDAGRLYVSVEGIGRTFIPKELGIVAGDILHGNLSVEEKTYDMEADGVTKREKPLVRWEAVDYTSKASVMEDAIMDAKIKALGKLEFKASDFFGVASEEKGVAA